MFRLDALVLLRLNEAKSWGTSIYSYIEAYQRALLLVANVGHAYTLSDLQCGWVGTVRVGSTSKFLVHGDPAVRYVIAIVGMEYTGKPK